MRAQEWPELDEVLCRRVERVRRRWAPIVRLVSGLDAELTPGQLADRRREIEEWVAAHGPAES